MALGDTQYQVNDLTARIKILENQARATNPGNRPSTGPNHPLAAVTSTGQNTAGADSDNFSRSVALAINSAVANIESLQFNQLSVITTFSTAFSVPIITIPVRPDPVVGELYRVTIAGSLVNPAASQFSLDMRLGGTAGPLVMSTASVNAGAFFTQSYYNVTTAGAAGIYTQNVFQIISTSGQAFIDASTATQSVPGANLVNPVFQLNAGFTDNTSAAVIVIRLLVVESLGFRQG